MDAAVPPQPRAGLPARPAGLPVRPVSLLVLLLAMHAPAASAAVDASGPGARVRGAGSDPPELLVEGLGATEGHVRLSWTPAEAPAAAAPIFELDESRLESFEGGFVRYHGPERASFVSGLEDGVHYFRVRQRPAADEGAWSPWSTAVAIEIRHHPLVLAWSLFAAGGLLVACIVGFLWFASARARVDELAPPSV